MLCIKLLCIKNNEHILIKHIHKVSVKAARNHCTLSLTLTRFTATIIQSETKIKYGGTS